MGSVLLIFLVFCVAYCVPLRSEFHVVLSVIVFWFVFTSSCLYKGACLIYINCVCLRILMSNTYYVLFLFCFVLFFSSCCYFLWVVLYWLPQRYSVSFIIMKQTQFNNHNAYARPRKGKWAVMYLWDTSSGGLLVPEGIIHPIVSVYLIYLLLKFTVPK